MFLLNRKSVLHIVMWAIALVVLVFFFRATALSPELVTHAQTPVERAVEATATPLPYAGLVKPIKYENGSEIPDYDGTCTSPYSGRYGAGFQNQTKSNPPDEPRLDDGGYCDWSSTYHYWKDGKDTKVDNPNKYNIHPAVDIYWDGIGPKKDSHGVVIKPGHPVLAICNGTIEYAGWKGSLGNVIVLKCEITVDDADDETVYATYAHLSAIDLEKDENDNYKSVKIGDKIGKVGSSGGDYGPHLHFQINKSDGLVYSLNDTWNPMYYIQAHERHYLYDEDSVRINQNLPAIIPPNQTTQLQIGFKNVGPETWLPGVVKMGTSNPFNDVRDYPSVFWTDGNTDWESDHRVILDTNQVKTNEFGYFNASFQPIEPGVYKDYFNLRVEGENIPNDIEDHWFPNEGITVTVKVCDTAVNDANEDQLFCDMPPSSVHYTATQIIAGGTVPNIVGLPATDVPLTQGCNLSESVNGTTYDFYCGNQNTRRVEVAVMLARWLYQTDDFSADLPPDMGILADVFTDMSDYGWGYGTQALQMVFLDGIMKGYSNNTLRPEDPISRAQVVTMIIRALLNHENELLDELDIAAHANTFDDVTTATAEHKYIWLAHDLGIVRGYTGGNFEPDRLVTRAELASMLYNAFYKTTSNQDLQDLRESARMTEPEGANQLSFTASYTADNRLRSGGSSYIGVFSLDDDGLDTSYCRNDSVFSTNNCQDTKNTVDEDTAQVFTFVEMRGGEYLTTEVHIPAGAFDKEYELRYMETANPESMHTTFSLASSGENPVYKGRSFKLEVHDLTKPQDEQHQQNFEFNKPITMTLNYADSSSSDLSPLYYDHSTGEWVDIKLGGLNLDENGYCMADSGGEVINHNSDNRTITFRTCHLTQFGLFEVAPSSLSLHLNAETDLTADFTGDLGSFSLTTGVTQTFSNLLYQGSYTVNFDPTILHSDQAMGLSVYCTDGNNGGISLPVDLASGKISIPLRAGQHLNCHFNQYTTGFLEPAELTAPRSAYRTLFERTSQPDSAYWAQSHFSDEYLVRPPGTFVLPNMQADEYGHAPLLVAGQTAPRPAYAINTAGERIAIFRSTVSGDYGNAAWELGDVREVLDVYLLRALGYDILDETALETANLSQYDLLILPAVRWGNESDVVTAISQTARDNVEAFVNAGGFVYAQSNAAYLAEAMDLLPAGTVNLSQPLQFERDDGLNTGNLLITDPASPLSFSWQTETLYVLTEPSLTVDDSMNVVAEFTNTTADNQPAIFSRQVGEGQVIVVNGHPTAPSRRVQLPIFFNSILWATSHRAELTAESYQIYNPDLDDPSLIPAHEQGTPVQTDITFNNLWDTPLYNVIITETVAAGFTISETEVTPSPANFFQNEAGEMVLVWQFAEVPPGDVSLSFIARTGEEQLEKGELNFVTGQATYFFGDACPDGGTGCLPGGTVALPGSIELTGDFTDDQISHQPTKLTSAMPARLESDRDLEGDRQYFIPADGVDLDITITIDNKEETRATSTVITDVVLLISPIQDLENQEKILERNEFERTIWMYNSVQFYQSEGDVFPYRPPNGYTLDDVIDLDDWDGETWAVFDPPGGIFTDEPPLNRAMDEEHPPSYITIPATYTDYISVTADNKLLLPAIVLTWDLGEWPGYHFEEPALRYILNSRELFSRTLTFHGNPGLDPGNEVVIRHDGGTVYTHLGQHPIFYREHLVSGQVFYPTTTTTSTLNYVDIWSRTHTTPLRSSFYDIFSWASCNCGGPGMGEAHAGINVTYQLMVDTDGDGIAETEVMGYPSRMDGAELTIIVKSKANVRDIPAEEMIIDLGVFKGLGVQIGPREATWEDSIDGAEWVSTTVTAAHDRLYLQHPVSLDGTSVITVNAKITSYEDVVAEHILKLLDGARFVYRQQYAGPSRYEVYDTHVRAVIGAAPDLSVTKTLAPVVVSTYGETVYYLIEIDDKDDPRRLYRNGRGDPFLQSYGGLYWGATSYVGGKEGYFILHSLVKPGEMTRGRIELDNNTTLDWNDVQIWLETPPGITATRTYTDNVPAPIFPDMPFLYVETIPEVGRGVYYFDITVSPDYDGPRGEVITIPVRFSGTGFPADFAIPPVQIGIEDDAGRVFQTLGPAQSLALTDTIPSNVDLYGAAWVQASDITALTDIITNSERADLFATFANTLTFSVADNGLVNFDLTEAMLDQLYVPQDDKVYLIVQGHLTPTMAGKTVANSGLHLDYTDGAGVVYSDTTPAVFGEAHGAKIESDYGCLEAYPSGNCLLTLGSMNVVTLQVTIFNPGDYRAETVSKTTTLPEGFTALTSTLPAVISGTQITWPNLGDIAPGSFVTVDVVLEGSLNSVGQAGRSPVPLFIPVVDYAHASFVDSFTDQTITARTSEAFLLPVAGGKPAMLYLPLVMRNFSPFDGSVEVNPIAIISQTISITGETFYSTTVDLPTTLPSEGYYYLSATPDALTPTRVDDQIAIMLNGVDVFTHTYGRQEFEPEYHTVQIPTELMQTLAGESITIELRDVYGVLIESTPIYIIHTLDYVEPDTSY